MLQRLMNVGRGLNVVTNRATACFMMRASTGSLIGLLMNWPTLPLVK